VAKHIEVMLEIQHMLAAAVAPFLAGNQEASVPNLDIQLMDPCFDPSVRAGWH
jgi:hypothetical protein